MLLFNLALKIDILILFVCQGLTRTMTFKSRTDMQISNSREANDTRCIICIVVTMYCSRHPLNGLWKGLPGKS